jgi:site-specific DNA recombinase
LSFAQFEREVTAERIRDKIAASKRKGLWMGGMVPLGYDADGRTLKPNEQEAKTVQSIYNLYFEHRTIRKVKEQADRLGLRSKARISKRSKKTSGGNSLGLGHIHAILTNPIYAGRIRHKKNVYEGKHSPIIKPELFDKVQTLLQQQSRKPRGKPQSSHSSPYVGKLFDETGDRLTPSHANKKGIRHRYYVSRRLIEDAANKKSTGSGKDANTIKDGWRLPAQPLEEAIARLISERFTSSDFTKLIIKNLSPSKASIRIERIKELTTVIEAKPAKAAQLTKSIHIEPGQIIVKLDMAQLAKQLKATLPQISHNHDNNHSDNHEPHIEGHTDNNVQGNPSSITAPFQLRKRGVETKLIIGGLNNELDSILIKNIAKAQQWYQDIKQGTTFDQIAEQEHTSIARIRQMINHAFIAPKIVNSILDGSQPIDFTSNYIQRNTLPSEWQKQHDLLSRL